MVKNIFPLVAASLGHPFSVFRPCFVIFCQCAQNVSWFFYFFIFFIFFTLCPPPGARLPVLGPLHAGTVPSSQHLMQPCLGSSRAGTDYTSWDLIHRSLGIRWIYWMKNERISKLSHQGWFSWFLLKFKNWIKTRLLGIVSRLL